MSAHTTTPHEQHTKPFKRGDHTDLSRDDVLPFQYIEHLGDGGSALVEEVEETCSGIKFAHKRFRRRTGTARTRFERELKNEIAILKRLSAHPHITRFHWSYTHRGNAGMLLTPVASHGDLAAYLDTIRETRKPPTSEQHSILRQSFGCLSSGLAFIHKHSVRHKDIKPQNILVHEGQMIFTDFGIALDTSGQDATTTGPPEAFTECYQAPEVAEHKPRSYQSDVFSLGCVFLEVATLLAPEANIEISALRPYWQKTNEIQNKLNSPSTSGSAWSQMFLICSLMLEPDRVRRCDAEAILQQIVSMRSESQLPYDLICKNCAVPVSIQPQDNAKDDGDIINPDIGVEALPDVNGISDDVVERPSQQVTSFTPRKRKNFIDLGKEGTKKESASRPLRPRERQAGYLYVFYDPLESGFVRIGRTNDVPRRLQQWKRHCSRDFVEFDQQCGGERVLIPNAPQVEKLVMQGLTRFHYKEKCKGCGLTHVGWFRTTPEHAARLIGIYSAWMARRPLTLNECLTWVLPVLMKEIVNLLMAVSGALYTYLSSFYKRKAE